MTMEPVKFGKDLPGYEYGSKQGPALIVLQVPALTPMPSSVAALGMI